MGAAMNSLLMGAASHPGMGDNEQALLHKSRLAIQGLADADHVDTTLRETMGRIAAYRDRLNKVSWMVRNGKHLPGGLYGERMALTLRSCTSNSLFNTVRLLDNLGEYLAFRVASLARQGREAEAVRLVRLLLDSGAGMDIVAPVVGSHVTLDFPGLVPGNRQIVATTYRMPFSIIWTQKAGEYLVGHQGVHAYGKNFEYLGPRLEQEKFDMGPYILHSERGIYVAAGGGATTISLYDHGLEKKLAEYVFDKPAGKIWLMPDGRVLAGLIDNNEGPHALLFSPDLDNAQGIVFPQGPVRLDGDIFHLAPLDDDRIVVMSTGEVYDQALFLYSLASSQYVDRLDVPFKDLLICTGAMCGQTLVAAGDSFMACLHLPSRTWHVEVVPEYSADLVSVCMENGTPYVYFLGSWYHNMLRWRLAPPTAFCIS